MWTVLEELGKGLEGRSSDAEVRFMQDLFVAFFKNSTDNFNN